MRFSQRIGKAPVKTLLQVDGIDESLKNLLWNIIIDEFIFKFNSTRGDFTLDDLCVTIWTSFFKKSIDSIPHYKQYYFSERSISKDSVIDIIREWYFNCKWYEIYDFVEFLSSVDSHCQKQFQFDFYCNIVLKREMSGFRIIEGSIAQITTDEEIQEIQEAIDDTNKWTNVNTHLVTSLKFLSDRKNPNYRNSIKESISAVEALCVIIADDKKASLGKALSIIEKKHSLHKALRESFGSLYGYTSDASGIRHSLLENDTSVDFEEAKFMLVSCSAFINFLKSKFTN